MIDIIVLAAQDDRFLPRSFLYVGREAQLGLILDWLPSPACGRGVGESVLKS